MKKVLAVDGNSILNRAYFAIKALSNSKGIPTNALMGYVNILLKNIEAVKPDRLVVAFDRKAPTFRHLMYDKYKSNRKGMPDDLAIQLPYAKEISEKLGFSVLEKDGIEADDILGTVAEKCKASDAFCCILTGDRDSLQLICDGHTSVLLATNTDTVVYDEAKFFEKYGTVPKGLIDIKALMGDSSDCIPGVPGIGEKTALALIGEYKTLDEVYANADALPVGPSAKEKIKNGRELAYLSKELATIKCDAEIPFDCDEEIRSDAEGLNALFTELEMFSTLKKISSSSIFAGISAPEPIYSEKAETVTANIDDIRALPELFCTFDFENCVGYFASDAKVLRCEFSQSELLGFIKENITKLNVFDGKPVYKYLYEREISVENTVSFDCMLAAYVANSGLQKYTPERVASHYLHLSCEEPDFSDTAFFTEKLVPVLLDELEKSGQKELYQSIEIPLSLVIADMETKGFFVDKDGLVSFGKDMEAEISDIENQIYFMTGETFNINSPKQLGTVLFEHLGLPSKKKTKSGYSTDAETLESIAHYHPVIELILEYRTLAKLKSTFIDAMVKVISEKDGRIHTSINQASTATGRLSSAEPNLQNIPVRQKRGKELRRFFKAADGNVLIDADYSQIELRLLAEISGDKDFKNAFVSGEDIHRVTASQVFNVPFELVSPELRSKAKAVNFGIIYGISAFSLSRDIGTTVAEAKKYIENYLARYGGVSEYLKNIVASAHKDGFVSTMLGRRRYIPELKSPRKPEQSFGERVAMNSPIQGTAADVIKKAMVNVHKRLSEFDGAKLILQVHDELIIEAPENIAENVAKMLKTEMENVIKTDVPLTAEVGIGKSWYDAKN